MPKGLFYSRGSHEADVARRAHMVALRGHMQEPTWTHVGTYMVRRVTGLAFHGPIVVRRIPWTSIV